MTTLRAYLRRSPCARAAWAVRNACIASRVGLLTRRGLRVVLGHRWPDSTIRRCRLTLERITRERVTR